MWLLCSLQYFLLHLFFLAKVNAVLCSKLNLSFSNSFVTFFYVIFFENNFLSVLEKTKRYLLANCYKPTQFFDEFCVKKYDGIVGSNPVKRPLRSYGLPKPNNYSGFLAIGRCSLHPHKRFFHLPKFLQNFLITKISSLYFNHIL